MGSRGRGIRNSRPSSTLPILVSDQPGSRETHTPFFLNVDTWTGQALDKANVTEFWNSNHRGGRQFSFIRPFVFPVVRYTKHKIQHFSLNKWIVPWHCALSPCCVTILAILFWNSFIFLNWTFDPLNTQSFCLLTSLGHHHHRLTFCTVFAESSWFLLFRRISLDKLKMLQAVLCLQLAPFNRGRTHYCWAVSCTPVAMLWRAWMTPCKDAKKEGHYARGRSHLCSHRLSSGYWVFDPCKGNLDQGIQTVFIENKLVKLFSLPRHESLAAKARLKVIILLKSSLLRQVFNKSSNDWYWVAVMVGGPYSKNYRWETWKPQASY